MNHSLTNQQTQGKDNAITENWWCTPRPIQKTTYQFKARSKWLAKGAGIVGADTVDPYLLKWMRRNGAKLPNHTVKEIRCSRRRCQAVEATNPGQVVRPTRTNQKRPLGSGARSGKMETTKTAFVQPAFKFNYTKMALRRSSGRTL